MMKRKLKDKEMSLRQSISLFWRAFCLLAGRVPTVFVSIAVNSVFSGLSPYVAVYLSAQIIDELAGARDRTRLVELVLITLAAGAVLGFVGALLRRWKNKAMSLLYVCREKIYPDKLMDMDYEDMDNQSTHDLLSQILQADKWSMWGLAKISGNVDELIRCSFRIIGALTLSVGLFTNRIPEAGKLAFLNHPLCNTLILITLLAVTILAPMFNNKADLYWSKNAEEATLSNRLFSFYGYELSGKTRALDVRIYGQESFVGHYIRKCNPLGPRSDIAKNAKGLMGVFRFLSAAVLSAFTGLVYVFVCVKAWAGAFGVGSVTQYVGAITSLSGAVSGLIGKLGDIRANGPFLQTMFEFLDIPNRMYQGSLTTEKRDDRQYDVEFRDVSFCYPGSSDYALRHVSIKFQVGRRLAVVGQNGSGKTTFIKLLCRLYDPTEGEILLNGIDIRKYSYRDYMDIFSVVFQDFQLLSLPIGQNVAACAEYDGERVLKSLNAAGFSERLSGLKQGLGTYIGRRLKEDGVEFSGGERQRLAIARALYKDAPFIILDEPTAALDPVAEAEIYEGFDSIVEDKTAIYISHRLSSCRFCDEIVVFDGGCVVQQGAHETLLADENGKYYELWNAQAQYYTA